MKSLHEELRDIRLERGVTLEQIYEKTKIRIHLLEKLENGDYSIAPIPYIRAFLKEYAIVLNLDPDRVIARYEKKIDSVRDLQPIDTPPDTKREAAGLPPDSTTAPITETSNDTSLMETPVQPEHEQPVIDEEPAMKKAESLPTTGDDASLPSHGDKSIPDAGDSDNAADETGEAGSPEADELSATVSEQEPPVGNTGSTSQQKIVFDKSDRIDNTAPVPESISEPTPESVPIDTEPEPDTKPPTLIDDTAPEPPLVSAVGSDSAYTRSPVPAQTPGTRLTIDDPKSSNTLFFILVAILFIIAAIVVVVMNRSGF